MKDRTNQKPLRRVERAFLATETACAKPEGERELGMLREQQIVQSGWSAELRGAWAERKPAQEAGARRGRI